MDDSDAYICQQILHKRNKRDFPEDKCFLKEEPVAFFLLQYIPLYYLCIFFQLSRARTISSSRLSFYTYYNFFFAARMVITGEEAESRKAVVLGYRRAVLLSFHVPCNSIFWSQTCCQTRCLEGKSIIM